MGDLNVPLPEQKQNHINEMTRVSHLLPFRNYTQTRYPALFNDIEKRHYSFREFYFHRQGMTAADRMSAFQYVRHHGSEDFSKRFLK